MPPFPLTFRSFLPILLPPCHPPSALSEPRQPPSLDLSLKSLFLTLHVLFPNELLPALDLLDRKSVTRLRCTQSNSSSEKDDDALSADRENINPQAVYYVRTSHQTRSSSRVGSGRQTVRDDVNYEVRLQGWNCTCAAFAFVSFAGEQGLHVAGEGEAEGCEGGVGVDVRSINDGMLLEKLWGEMEEAVEKDEEGRRNKNGGGEWSFGGVTRGEKVPVCKHLLACILVERVKALKQCVEERVVSKVEMAGWAAGWGS